MKLNAQEISWINTQLKTFKIPYRELYEEIYDHILSAIELKKNQGDEREVSDLLVEVIVDDFNGYDGIKMIARERSRRMQAAIWQRLTFTLKQNAKITIIYSAIILILIVFLPFQIRLINYVLGSICFSLIFLPYLYLIYFNGFKNVFTDRSVKLRTMVVFASYTMYMFNVLFCVIFNLIRMFNDHFKAMDCNPLILGMLLVCMMAYTINFIYLYNHEFKTEVK